MVFHRKRKNVVNPSISINNVTIEGVHSFNFLGLTLNTNLTWKDHLNIVSKKPSRAIVILNSLKYSFPIHTFITIYNTLILSHLNYCLLSWGTNSDSLFGLQKRVVRLITLNHYKVHIDLIFKAIQLLKLKDLYQLKILKLYYNMINNKLQCNLVNCYICYPNIT